MSGVRTKEKIMIQIHPRLSPLTVGTTETARKTDVLTPETSQTLGSQFSLTVNNKFFHRALQTLYRPITL